MITCVVMVYPQVSCLRFKHNLLLSVVTIGVRPLTWGMTRDPSTCSPLQICSRCSLISWAATFTQSASFFFFLMLVSVSRWSPFRLADRQQITTKHARAYLALTLADDCLLSFNL